MFATVVEKRRRQAEELGNMNREVEVMGTETSKDERGIEKREGEMKTEIKRTENEMRSRETRTEGNEMKGRETRNENNEMKSGETRNESNEMKSGETRSDSNEMKRRETRNQSNEMSNEQKTVIAEYVVQQYLQEIWDGGLSWGAGKMIGFFLLFVIIPPVWFFFSLPIKFRMNKIPVVKFLAYLTGHIYFMLFLCLTAVLPPHPTARSSLLPHWYEMVAAAWYVGNGLAHYTNPGAKGGLAWIKPLIAILIHFSALFVSPYYWSLLIYIRNQFVGLTLLFCWIQILDQ